MTSPALPFALGSAPPELPFFLGGLPAAPPAPPSESTQLFARIDSLHALVEEARSELHELRRANVQVLKSMRSGALTAEPPPGESRFAVDATVHIKLFGDFEVRAGERRIDRWTSRKARQIVAYLAMHRERAVPRELLAEFFWPESSPARGANNLSIAVHRVRVLLGELATGEHRGIIVEQGTYRLDAGVPWTVDALEFQQLIARAESALERPTPEAARSALRDAVALYAGDFMAADAYEEWTLALRERLAAGYQWALGWLAEDAASAGDWLRSLHFMQTLVEYDPLNEAAHRGVIRAHASLGNPSLALRQFERCEELLRTELGAAPSRETLALAHQLRSAGG